MIEYFRHSIYSKSQVGDLFMIQLATSQLEAGIPQLLLEEPTILIPYLTPTWILSMRQFLSNHNLTITLTNATKLLPKSPTDLFIMDMIRLKSYTLSQQRDLNWVRLHLQVTTLDDLVDSNDRTKIAVWALEARRCDTFVSKPAWPRHDSLSATQRRLWKRYISSQYLR